MLRAFASLLIVLAAASAQAQQAPAANGLLLIARPELADPNFARTVVLVTRTADDSAVGVILNRPVSQPLSQLLLPAEAAANYRDSVYVGGPVAPRTLVAVLRAGMAPAAASFHVLKDVYLTMHPENLGRLLADPAARYRIYAGFAGWLPRQLESEVMRDSWYFLQADEATLFRKTTEGMWEELLERARRLAPRAANGALQ